MADNIMGSLADQSTYDPATGMPYPGNAPDYGDLSQRMTNAQQRLAAGLYEAGAMPGRAFGTVPGGPPTPEEEANWGAGTAVGMLGAARLPGGAPAGSVGAGGGRLVQPYVHTGEIANPGESFRAYHSSPYTFDRFDPSMIGTGEGAQLYGHGFYFAENPAVSGQGGQYWGSFINRFPPHEMEASKLLAEANFNRDQAIVLAQQRIENTRGNIAAGSDNPFVIRLLQASLPDEQAALALLKSKQSIIGPRTYEVNINARPEQMLNWYAPLHAQPTAAQAIARAAGMHPDEFDITKGAALYRRAGDYFGPQQSGSNFNAAASAGLAEAGIPGIRYLDAGSRVAQPVLKTTPAGDVISSHYPPKSYNYVIFDPNKIDIRKMYAVPGAVGAGAAGMGALAAQDNYQPQ